MVTRGKVAQKGADEPYHARILSRLYWPNLDREHFLLPQPIVALQHRYETGYEQLKSARKLTWLNQLGLATVELELQDRTVTVQCKTYEATVIYAFQDPAATSPVRRTVDQLVDQLQMDDDLITSALSFWVANVSLPVVGTSTLSWRPTLPKGPLLSAHQPPLLPRRRQYLNRLRQPLTRRRRPNVRFTGRISVVCSPMPVPPCRLAR